MPTYRFECVLCEGGFEVVRSMAENAGPTPCPDCHQPARRVFGIQTTGFSDPALRAARDASARSADEPSVVTSVPGRSRRATPITTDPRHRRLPRP